MICDPSVSHQPSQGVPLVLTKASWVWWAVPGTAGFAVARAKWQGATGSCQSEPHSPIEAERFGCWRVCAESRTFRLKVWRIQGRNNGAIPVSVSA